MRRIFACLSAVALASACGSSGGGSGSTTAADAAKETAGGADAGVADSKADGTTVSDSSATDTPKADVGTELPKVDTKKDTAKPADDQITGAVLLEPGTPADDDLIPTGDVDWYYFEGKKGQLVRVNVFAQGTSAPFAADAIDTVITLYGPDQKPYAFNDDPVPRDNNDSDLFTILPADGKYYIQITECNTWLNIATSVPQGASCAAPVDKNLDTYKIGVFIIDPAKDGAVMDTEKGNDAKSAIEVPYLQNSQGQYMAAILYGYFTDPSDVDVYMVKLPKGMTIGDGKRPSLSFDTYVGGPLGNGSTTSAGMVSLASAQTPTDWIAQSDFSNELMDLATPVTADGNYLLYVPAKGDKKGANDFYIIMHTFGGGNPVEAKDTENNVATTAEVLTNAQKTGLPKYYVEGNLPAGDVDYFSFAVKDVPATATKVSVSCAAQLDGSGLREFTIDLLNDKGGTLATATESDKKYASISQTDIPAGAATLTIKLSAAKQDPKVSGTYYRCGVHVQEPTKK